MSGTPAERMAAQLGREARERFLLEMCRSMVGLAGTVQGCLTTLMGQSGTSAEMAQRRDTWTQFQLQGDNWRDGTIKSWQQYLAKPIAVKQAVQATRIKLELQDQDVVESQIVVSRFVESMMDAILHDYNQLRMRMKELEGIVDLAPRDIVRPEVLASIMLEQWTACNMPEGSWALIQQDVGNTFQDAMVKAYQACNAFLSQRGILPKGFKQVRTQDRHVVSLKSGAEHIARQMPPGEGRDTGGYGNSIAGGGYGGGVSYSGGDTASGGYAPGFIPAPGQMGGGPVYMRPGPGWVSGSNLNEAVAMAGRGPQPLELAVVRAQSVIGQLKALLQHRGVGFNMASSPRVPSPALAQALAQRHPAPAKSGSPSQISKGDFAPTVYQPRPEAKDVQEAVGAVREATSDLKKQDITEAEKTVIEVVALMFQSILTEDRIPPTIRIWVARLQMPVLRIATAEPEFFDSLDHPARLLIDRIGSCVLGFDQATVNRSELEAEIKRVVQVIEQFPDTGRQVFQKVYDEFLQFLSKMLTSKGVAQRVVNVVQQVEQKETLAIKYTIEMRNVVKDIPVRDEIRQFLFKVWADVLAVAAVKYDPLDEQTQIYKRAATDLVWSASAKSSRSARTKVIQNLPGLLATLRQGMTALGLAPAVQETHIKIISDTLADAFMSKTEVVSFAQIEAMTRQLARLEDVVPPDGMGDLPLDAESIEMMLGIDASSMTVVADGGVQPSPDMVAWARSLTVGTWFTLDHNGVQSPVQFAWRSGKQKLHLFSASNGKNYLIQAGRLAAYLQAGLLVPMETEALTVRATRDALAKIEANPERLVS